MKHIAPFLPLLLASPLAASPLIDYPDDPGMPTDEVVVPPEDRTRCKATLVLVTGSPFAVAYDAGQEPALPVTICVPEPRPHFGCLPTRARQPALPHRQARRIVTAMQTTFTLRTTGPGLSMFTAEVERWLVGAGGSDGLLTLMVRHTSCSLLLQENADPDVQTDLAAFLHRLVPPADAPPMHYLRHVLEGPDDMPAHIKAALLPVSLQIPVAAGRMRLGTWQGIYLVEHRTAPHRREVAAHFASG